MATNPYVRWWDDTNEQNLLQSLMTEAIKFHGLDVVYMPRSMRREDTLYNEDVLSKFTSTYNIEAYVKNVMGWDGQGDFLSKFGLRVDDKVTLLISRERFEQLVPPARRTAGQITANTSTTTVVGTNTRFKRDVRVGDVITTTSSGQSRAVTGITNSTALTINAAFTTAVTSEYFSVPVAEDIPAPPARPMEGDLIYLPSPLAVMMEVKFVEHEKSQGQFYPLGKLTFYEVHCEIWTYSHEVLETGDSNIDDYAQKYEYQLELELASGSGTYLEGEEIYQGDNLAEASAAATVVSWDSSNNILRVGNTRGTFTTQQLVKGYESGAAYYLDAEPDTMLLPTDPTADNDYLNEQDNDIIDRRERHRIVGGV